MDIKKAYLHLQEPLSAKRRWHSSIGLLLGAVALVFVSKAVFQPARPINAQYLLDQCSMLGAKPGVPSDFYERKVSDRFEKGTRPVLVTNATIWTGGRNGTEVIFGDMFIDGGIIKAVGYIPKSFLDKHSAGSLVRVNAQGSWVTPGLFDLHSHIGVLSAPLLTGALDGNSPKGPIIPWLRSLDALNTRDDALALTVSGGVTGGMILPGSGNAIGGQAFPIKYRRTSMRTPGAMVIEPPFTLNGSNTPDPSKPLHWRHMKHATGENQIRYGTRMDSTWAFRQAYETARKVKVAQDSFCVKVQAGRWDDPEVKGKDFPFDLQWEALVDVLRGRVKINCHTYETEDVDFLMRLTNEFKFPIAALHHAHENYLVPDTLKAMYNGPPATASFALHARYKRESYRGSEYAPKILADNGISVIMKSDHPVVNSRHLIFEAQQAHFYSLPTNLALASVTTAPADAAGLGHRIGRLLEGYDADFVIWDSHPLALGATPRQVYIDGIKQISSGLPVPNKPQAFQRPPMTPEWDEEIKETLEYDGLPPLKPVRQYGSVAFMNVTSMYTRSGMEIQQSLNTIEAKQGVTLIFNGGKLVDQCSGFCTNLLSSVEHTLDLKGGSIILGLTAYGSPLGLSEIAGEPSTGDGGRFNPLRSVVPAVMGDEGGTTDAVDALQFEGRDTLYAYRFGVTSAISTSSAASSFTPGGNTFSGTSVAFRTGYSHALEKGAIIKEHVAFHMIIAHGFQRAGTDPGVSTQIATLRNLLEGGGEGKTAEVFKAILDGEMPLIIQVHQADIMATLIRLKGSVEDRTGTPLKMTFSGATESHLIASEIAAAGISVIVNPLHPYPGAWETKRILPGPPLTKETTITSLLKKNVTVAIGVSENSMARNVMLDIAWASLDSGMKIEEEDALALGSTNLYKIFGLEKALGNGVMDDLVAYAGGSFKSFEGKPVAIISPLRGIVDVL